MLTIRKIGRDSLLVYIKHAFAGDDLLNTKFHIAPNDNYEECAADTFNTIVDFLEAYPDTIFYGIKYNGEKIGYITILPSLNILHSFGITKRYRSEMIKRRFMEFVNSRLHNRTVVLLYEKNIRAINFLKKNGFRQSQVKLKDRDENVIKLQYSVSCQ